MRRPDLFETLHGWVSVSGVVHGTMMADWLLDRWRLRPILRAMLWYHQAERSAVRDLRRTSNPRLGPPFVETLFPMIHVAAFPLRRHLSCYRARLWHRRFRRQGPSDSVVLLDDLLRLPGVVIPVWGADHYMRSGWNIPQAVSRIIAKIDQSSGIACPLGDRRQSARDTRGCTAVYGTGMEP